MLMFLLLLDYPYFRNRKSQVCGSLGFSYPYVLFTPNIILSVLRSLLNFSSSCIINKTKIDMSDINEKQLLLYAQMANLVNLILQWPNSQINIKEIAESFSKVSNELKIRSLLCQVTACNVVCYFDIHILLLGSI